MHGPDLLVANSRFEVHHVERQRARPAARRGADRAARPGGHACWPTRSATCCRRPASPPSAGTRRTRRARRGRGPAARRGPAQRVAVHPGPPDAAAAAGLLDPGRRADPGHRAAARRAHARPAALRAVAVRPGVRRAVCRRPDRRPAGPPAGRPVRAAPGHDHRRDAERRLAGLAGLHRPRRERPRAGHRRRVRADRLHGRVQPAVRHLPAGADRPGPGGPGAVRVAGDQERHHRRADRAVGGAGRADQPADRDRGGLLLLGTPLLLPRPLRCWPPAPPRSRPRWPGSRRSCPAARVRVPVREQQRPAVPLGLGHQLVGLGGAGVEREVPGMQPVVRAAGQRGDCSTTR